LAPRVTYPAADALIAARDSNFIFGSVGSADARLTINRRLDEVHPNGAFIAYPPVPAQPRYELVVTRGGERQRLVHPVRLLPQRTSFAIDQPLRADTASLTPGADLQLRPDEPVRVSVRATTDARVILETPRAGRVQLQRGAARGSAGALVTADVAASRLARGARLLLRRCEERITLEVPPVELTSTDATALALLGPAGNDPDRVVQARPVPA